MDYQRLGVAGGVISMLRGAWLSTIFSKRHSCESKFLFFYSHPHTETHKDPVGTALHIQEANMDDTTQAKTHTERAAAGYMTTEKRAKRARFPETSVFIADVEDHVTFCNKSSDWLKGVGKGFMM
ncbi:hypothetical protein TNCV_1662921 [Trichonephila clavipes]|nr:hypothetical protein TNCV_1662921 [Trichonephila clavipes]